MKFSIAFIAAALATQVASQTFGWEADSAASLNRRELLDARDLHASLHDYIGELEARDDFHVNDIAKRSADPEELHSWAKRNCPCGSSSYSSKGGPIKCNACGTTVKFPKPIRDEHGRLIGYA